MRSSVVTDQDVATMRDMRAKNIGWTEIEKTIGKPLKTIQQKFYSFNKVEATVKRKHILKKKKVEVDVMQPVAQKPMIALVGTPSEVTATIKELFS